MLKYPTIQPDLESARQFSQTKKLPSFKTVPLERPYLIPLRVKIDSQSSTCHGEHFQLSLSGIMEARKLIYVSSSLKEVKRFP